MNCFIYEHVPAIANKHGEIRCKPLLLFSNTEFLSASVYSLLTKCVNSLVPSPLMFLSAHPLLLL